MYKVIAHVYSKKGLHARPSALIVKKAKTFESSITIINPKNNVESDAKQVMELLMLVADYNSELIIIAKGIDEEEAALAIADLINTFYIIEEEY